PVRLEHGEFESAPALRRAARAGGRRGRQAQGRSTSQLCESHGADRQPAALHSQPVRCARHFIRRQHRSARRRVTRGPTDEAALVNELLRLVNGSWVAQACYVIARLGIPDLLAAGARSSDDLAAATNTNASALHRLLNGLGSVGICNLRDDGKFEMT